MSVTVYRASSNKNYRIRACELSEIRHTFTETRDELLSNLVAVEDFNVGDRSRDNVKDQHSSAGPGPATVARP